MNMILLVTVQASENVQLIACRALDASYQRFAPMPVLAEDKGSSAQK